MEASIALFVVAPVCLGIMAFATIMEWATEMVAVIRTKGKRK